MTADSAYAPLGCVTVTGCAGFIGSHLADSLLAAGESVVGIDAFTDTYGQDLKLTNLVGALRNTSFDFQRLDLATSNLTDALRGTDVVFHLAAEPGVTNSWGSGFERYVRNNVLGTQRLLEAAVTAGVDRFVYASSSSVYGEAPVLPTPESAPARPRSPYGITKLAGEHLCAAYAAADRIAVAILRFFTVYGPRQRPDMAFQRILAALLQDVPVPVLGDGLQTRDFTYVDDVIAALRSAPRIASIEAPTVNVGRGQQVTLEACVDHMASLVGARPRRSGLPAARGEVRHVQADLSRAAELLRYEPSTSLEVGLRAFVEWMAPDRLNLTQAAPT